MTPEKKKITMVEIPDHERIPIQITRTDRRSLSIRVASDGSILVRAPRSLSDKKIKNFVLEKSSWIKAQQSRARRTAAEAAAAGPIGAGAVDALKARAKSVIPARVAARAAQIGVTYGRITIRLQKSRWGSCSAAGNLSFNCLLMLCPEEVWDYVIVHELCHRKEMNHSKRFWDLVGRFCPQYRQAEDWLKKNGSALMLRVEPLHS